MFWEILQGCWEFFCRSIFCHLCNICSHCLIASETIQPNLLPFQRNVECMMLWIVTMHGSMNKFIYFLSVLLTFPKYLHRKVPCCVYQSNQGYYFEFHLLMKPPFTAHRLTCILTIFPPSFFTFQHLSRYSIWHRYSISVNQPRILQCCQADVQCWK